MEIFQAVNKLAEIMNRRDMNLSGKKGKGSSADLRRKEKECRKLQQDMTNVLVHMSNECTANVSVCPTGTREVQSDGGAFPEGVV